jgi:hypothetical protein
VEPPWYDPAHLMTRAIVVLVVLLGGGGLESVSAQVRAEVSVHYGAPCPAATKYDRWCLPGEAVVGRELLAAGGSTRVLRVELPSDRTISRIQLTMTTRGIACGCALFNVRKGERLAPSVCQPYEKVPAGRATFGVPRINGNFVTVTFTNQEPYVQDAFLRVYYLK